MQDQDYPQQSIVRPEYYRYVNWHSIFMGVFTFLAIQFCFTLLGSAIGMSAYDVGGNNPGTGSLVAGGVYGLVTTLISFFLAGWFASRIGHFREASRSLAHGFGVWAVICTVFAYLVVGSIGTAVRSAAVASPTATQLNRSTNPSVRSNNTPTRTETLDAAQTTKNAVAGGSWFGFIAFALGAIACLFGAVTGYSRKHLKVETDLEQKIDRRSAA
jgi:ABC-type transport system involved in multi-copper enzyme maturation permease subunit